MNGSTQTAFEQIMAAASDATTAYINAIAVREVARVSAPPQDQLAAAMSQKVNVAGQTISVTTLLIGGAVLIGALWMLKK